MDFGVWMDKLPLLAVFILTIVACMCSVEVGAVLAQMALRRRPQKEPDGPLGSLVGALLGLLAFILAFTFGLAASRFDVRRQLVLQESNAIGTTYLRAGLLPLTQCLEVRRLLREYADVRLSIKFDNMHQSLKKSEEVQKRLWTQAESLVAADMDSELRVLFIASLNELIDLHQSRKTVGLQYRVPGSVWLVVHLLTGLSMLAIGYQVGMAGLRRMRGSVVLAAAFSLVILLIADIDRPGEGMLRVSQQPIADAMQMMLDDTQ